MTMHRDVIVIIIKMIVILSNGFFVVRSISVLVGFNVGYCVAIMLKELFAIMEEFVGFTDGEMLGGFEGDVVG